MSWTAGSLIPLEPMSTPISDREQQTRLKFLDEAQELLSSIETILLEVDEGVIEPVKLDASLRAAHSVKGGAAMMRYSELSDVAHHLEDIFKVLKARRPRVAPETVSLLLSSVDCMNQIAELSRQQASIDPEWVQEQISSVFDQLREQVGELDSNDEQELLAQDSGQDISVILFESEVEGCLKRLEGVLDHPDRPCLDTELSLLAEELSGLGDMLQLSNFSSLCQSISTRLELEPHRLNEIAEQALRQWRNAQALVMIDQASLVDTELQLDSSDSSSVPSTPLAGSLDQLDLSTLEFPEDEPEETLADLDLSGLDSIFEPIDSATPDSESESADPFSLASLDLSRLDDVPISEGEPDAELSLPQLDVSPLDAIPVDDSQAGNTGLLVEAAADSLIVPLEPTLTDPVPTAFNPTDTLASAKTGSSARPETSDAATIRVPVKRLGDLDNLCGELTIGCNGLNLRLSRLRNLMNVLVQRVLELEHSNVQLRNAYDQVATQAMGQYSHPVLDLSHLRPEGFDILELDTYNELHPIWQQVMETIVWLQEVTGDMDLLLHDAEQTTFEFNRVTKRMQTAVTQSRMRPLNELVGRFPRAIRDLSLQFNKQVDLKVYGGGTLIDQTILEKLSDPLMHLLRNAFDHGIEDLDTRLRRNKPEKGLIEIRAGYRGNQTLIAIRDDGGGIDFEKIRSKARRIGVDSTMLDGASQKELTELLFEPGFSTAETVTTLSGRGVGMDVVKTNIEEVGGTITLDTEPGQGTTFTLSVPFTLSVLRILMVEGDNGMLMAFPADTIEQMVLVTEMDPFITVANRKIYEWEGYMVPKVDLNAWLQFNCPTRPTEIEDTPIMSVPGLLILSQGDDLACVPIQRCWGEREVAIRQIEGPFPMPAGFGGTTILGDGQVLPIVNVPDLFDWMAHGAKQAVQRSDGQAALHGKDKMTVLVVDDSINVRRFLTLTLEKAGYRPEEARDGQDALDKIRGGLNVDAVVCDVEMPRLDGYGFLAQIKKDQAHKGVPVIMLTSRTGDKHRQLALNLGASAYFTKPCKERELIHQIKQLVNQQPTTRILTP